MEAALHSPSVYVSSIDGGEMKSADHRRSMHIIGRDCAQPISKCRDLFGLGFMYSERLGKQADRQPAETRQHSIREVSEVVVLGRAASSLCLLDTRSERKA